MTPQPAHIYIAGLLRFRDSSCPPQQSSSSSSSCNNRTCLSHTDTPPASFVFIIIVAHLLGRRHCRSSDLAAWLAVLLHLLDAAGVVAALLDEARPRRVPHLRLPAAAEGLVISAVLAQQVQSVAQRPRAQPHSAPIKAPMDAVTHRLVISQLQRQHQHKHEEAEPPGESVHSAGHLVAASLVHSPRHSCCTTTTTATTRHRRRWHRHRLRRRLRRRRPRRLNFLRRSLGLASSGRLYVHAYIYVYVSPALAHSTDFIYILYLCTTICIIYVSHTVARRAVLLRLLLHSFHELARV